MLTSNTFKLFLELEPQLRDVIINFYDSKYGRCLKQLDDMKDNMMLDMYLAAHVNKLLSKIRSRSLVQYFSPYSSADLRLMANSFNSSVASLEDELMTLILEGKIQARIDSHNKVIISQCAVCRHQMETLESAGKAVFHPAPILVSYRKTQTSVHEQLSILKVHI